MTDTSGGSLRQRREQQQIALATISEQTKIKLSLLEDLERDDLSRWPSGIFRRAFIRAYALAIGMDPEAVMREVMERHPDPGEIIETESPLGPLAGDGRSSGGPPTRFRYLVGSALRRLPALTSKAAAPVPPSAPAEKEPPPPVLEPRAEEAPPVVLAAAPADPPPPAAPLPDPDLAAIAHLCTEFACADRPADLAPLFAKAAALFSALGIIAWIWDPDGDELRAAVAHGYSDNVLAQLPRVRRDANNATAAAFRSAQTCAVHGAEGTTGALAVPLMTPAGCVGVLAIELPHGSEQSDVVRALMTVIAAQAARAIPVPRAAGMDRRQA